MTISNLIKAITNSFGTDRIGNRYVRAATTERQQQKTAALVVVMNINSKIKNFFGGRGIKNSTPNVLRKTAAPLFIKFRISFEGV